MEIVATEKRSTGRKIAFGFLNLLVYLAIVGVILFGAPRFLSWKLGTQYPIAAITSGSMWAVLTRGDMVFIRHASKEELAVGDIVVWQNEKGFTIHRIETLNSDTVVTKGDANFSSDPPVPYDKVIGKTVMWGSRVIRIPYVGLISVMAGEYRTKNLGS